MFTTREEALTAMQEVLATMGQMLSYADEEIIYANDEIEALLGELEAQYNEIYDAILQLLASSARYLNIEMRNYTALTVLQARQAIREVKAII